MRRGTSHASAEGSSGRPLARLRARAPAVIARRKAYEVTGLRVLLLVLGADLVVRNEGGPIETEVALALRWSGEPSYERLAAFARAVTLSLARTIAQARPVYLILDGDVAQTVGAILKEDWAIASEVLVIDGIALRDFDYIDLGRIRMPSNTVPVTIKSLVFSQDPRG